MTSRTLHFRKLQAGSSVPTIKVYTLYMTRTLHSIRRTTNVSLSLLNCAQRKDEILRHHPQPKDNYSSPYYWELPGSDCDRPLSQKKGDVPHQFHPEVNESCPTRTLFCSNTWRTLVPLGVPITPENRPRKTPDFGSSFDRIPSVRILL